MEIIQDQKEFVRLLKIHEAAMVLNVSKAQVDRLIKLGYLPFIRVGKNMRIDPNDLQEFLEVQRKKYELEED